MKTKVDLRSERYLPDIIPADHSDHVFNFEVVHLSEATGDELEPDTVGLRLEFDQIIDNERNAPYLTTEWSRHQLLQALGTREKWFNPVSYEEQAYELNMRRGVLASMNFRTVRGGDEENFSYRSVRGIVSRAYSDFPNTDIMKALCELMPPEDTYVLSRYSGQTDRAFYVYTILDTPIGFPGRECYPGLLIKNSEVGFTSLWIIPFLLFPATRRVAVMEKRHLLRRVHRGKINNLKESFLDAMNRAAPLWSDLSSKLARLHTQVYLTQDEVLESMDTLILQVQGSKLFTLQCRNTYKAANHTNHTALGMFDAIVETAGNAFNQDVAFRHNAIAGAVLLKLIT